MNIPKLTLYLMVFGAIIYTSSCDITCSMSENVTLKLSVQDVCPNQEVIASCAVKNTSSESALIWRCPSFDTISVQCSAFIGTLNCGLLEKVNITANCPCSITVFGSNLTFTTPPNIGDGNKLTCSDGKEEKSVHVSTKGLTTPILSFTNTTGKEEGIHEVKLWWEHDEAIPRDTEYVVIVMNSSSLLYNETVNTDSITLILYGGIYYDVNVTARRCDGNVKNSTSLTIYFEDQVFPSDFPDMSSTNLSTAAIVGIILSVLVICAVLVALVIVTPIVVMSILNKRDQENGHAVGFVDDGQFTASIEQYKIRRNTKSQ